MFLIDKNNPVFCPLTNKPAVIALLHHIYNVALLQLQLVLVARQVVVHSLVPVLEKTMVT